MCSPAPLLKSPPPPHTISWLEMKLAASLKMSTEYVNFRKKKLSRFIHDLSHLPLFTS